ncbi:MAG: hybrid sensor histidine kinase/response regulator [Bdellovibrionales bacterium]
MVDKYSIEDLRRKDLNRMSIFAALYIVIPINLFAYLYIDIPPQGIQLFWATLRLGTVPVSIVAIFFLKTSRGFYNPFPCILGSCLYIIGINIFFASHAGGLNSPYAAAFIQICYGLAILPVPAYQYLLVAMCAIGLPVTILAPNWGELDFAKEYASETSHFIIATAIFYIFRKVRNNLYVTQLELKEKLATQDIDIQKKAEQLISLRKDVLRQQEELEIANRLSDLAAQVAHDIRSPLTALKVAFADNTPKTKDVFELGRTALVRINDIANNLLNYRKHLSAVLETEPLVQKTQRPYILSPRIDQLISEKRVAGAIKQQENIELVQDSSHLVSFANVDSLNIMRIISNLLDNSLEACTEKGKISLSLKIEGQKFVFRIKDTGKGIPQHLLSKVGQKGFSYGKESGNGLGLYFAKDFLKSNGGEIDIRSQEGVGTDVVISFPLAPCPAWSLQKIQVDAKNYFVVVDDDPSLHQLWAQKLESLPTKPTLKTFLSPDDFLKWYSTSPGQPFMLIIDYEFADKTMNGLDLISKYNLSQAILVTSHFENESVLEQVERLKIKMIPKSLMQHVELIVT